MEVKVKAAERVEEITIDEPVSPTGQYFNSSALSVAIIVVFESEIPIDDSPTFSTLENLLLPVNPRFSCIMIKDEEGTQRWKKVTVKLEEHINIPIFPSGLDTYDTYVQDYMSKISIEPLPQSRPLWDMHLIKYPTKQCAGTLVFKLHHALGDGFSLMGALFSCIQRADNPSLPLTFPSQSKPKPNKNGVMGVVSRLPVALSLCLNTVRDFGWSFLKSNMLEDDRSPVRSGSAGVEFTPINLSSVEFSLLDLHKIKSKIGGTINDVISGIVFCGIQLYLESSTTEGLDSAKASQVTALVLLNTRMITSYQPPNEMMKPDAKSPWGNQFGFIHVPIPTHKTQEDEDPLQFVQKARQILKAKKNSLCVFLTGRLLEFLRKLRGPEETAKYIHTTLRNTSLTISNLTGPIEQMIIANHPVRSFYFMVVGAPQSLSISAISYKGKLKLAMGSEKGFINPKLLVSCMETSFKRIFKAALST